MANPIKKSLNLEMFADAATPGPREARAKGAGAPRDAPAPEGTEEAAARSAVVEAPAPGDGTAPEEPPSGGAAPAPGGGAARRRGRDAGTARPDGKTG